MGLSLNQILALLAILLPAQRCPSRAKKHCPYELLGLKLPSYDPWALLQLDPEELRKQLSSSRVAA